MRKLLTALILAVAAPGCATLSSGGASYSGPLDAYLLPSSAAGAPLSFHVNKPAHVAVFRIYPGHGATMVYPTPGYASMDGQVFSGIHRMDAWSTPNRAQYIPAAAIAQPQFFMLIASEQPLNIEQFGPYGDRLSRAMGVRFASSAYSSMERLVELTVPNVQAEDWVVDYYVQWPELGPPQFMEIPHVRLTCGDKTYYVRADRAVEAAEFLCPAEGEAPIEGEAEPIEDDDTPDLVEPRRRAPVEVTDRIASTQLEDPERWTALRRAVAEERFEEIERNAFDGRRPTRSSAASDRSADRPFSTGTIGRSGIGRDSGGATSRSPAVSPPTRERGASPAGASRGDSSTGSTRAAPPAARPDGGAARGGSGSGSRETPQ